MRVPSHAIDLLEGRIEGQTVVERKLSQLRGCFYDPLAYQEALEQGDPLVYKVSSVEVGVGPGDLHYGLGWVAPGRVGHEYYLTKGHLHEWRDAAEVYVGLRGRGLMLLESEDRSWAWSEVLEEGRLVYVPGHTAHRTVNTGNEPLIYLGIYPASAGHDYGVLEGRNFRQVVLATPNGPQVLDRDQVSRV